MKRMEAIKRWGTTVDVVVIMVVLFALVAVLLSTLISSPHRSSSWQATACLSNIKQCLTATAMYSGDYDGRLPNRDQWMDQLLPYTKNEGLYHCPIARQKGTPEYGYAYYAALANRRATDWEEPASVPALYDSLNMARNASDLFTSLPPIATPPGQPRRSVGFLDGHTEIEPADWKGWKP